MMLVLFGSLADVRAGRTSAHPPRDANFGYHGCSAADAREAAMTWLAEQKLDLVPAIHEMAEGFILPGVSADDAHEVVVGGSVKIYRELDERALPCFLRIFVRRDKEDVATLREEVNPSGVFTLNISPDPGEDTYYGQGLQALRSAWSKLTRAQRRAVAREFSGWVPVLAEGGDLSPEAVAALGTDSNGNPRVLIFEGNHARGRYGRFFLPEPEFRE